MQPSPITWTDYSGGPLNFVMRGKAPGECEVSPGCKNCYARTILTRNPSAFQDHTTFSEAKLERIRRLKLEPGKRSRPMAFVVDMGDLFHPRVPDDFILYAVRVMERRPDIDFQILTKRADRMAQLLCEVPDNIWCGVTAENQEMADQRIRDLCHLQARVRFLSCEPMLEKITPDLNGIHWVIVGGESGPGRRPFKEDWAKSLLELCKGAGTAFFYKQGSAMYPGRNDTLDGREWKEWP